jgi:hypothetical protein
MRNHLIIFSENTKLILSNCLKLLKPIQIPLEPSTTLSQLLSGVLSQFIVIAYGRFGALCEKEG